MRFPTWIQRTKDFHLDAGMDSTCLQVEWCWTMAANFVLLRKAHEARGSHRRPGFLGLSFISLRAPMPDLWPAFVQEIQHIDMLCRPATGLYFRRCKQLLSAEDVMWNCYPVRSRSLFGAS